MTKRSGSGSEAKGSGVFRALGRGLRWVALDLIGAVLTTFTFWTLFAAAVFFLAFFYFGAGT
ncbi:MAG: hypothetical protein ACOC91_02910 [bacterium]